MAIKTVHAQVSLPAISGVTQDVVINTFTFTGDVADSTAADLAAIIEPELVNFYNVAPGAGSPIASSIAKNRSRATGACEIRWYDITTHLSGSNAGPPVLTTQFTLGADNNADPLPSEVAVTLSFHGTFAAIPEFGPGTRPKSRHRGRVFIGPLTESALANAASPNFEPQVNVNLRNDISDAAEELMAAVSPNDWAVWSRTNAAVYPVVGGWVDNAFDTIRGRGNAATTRTDWGSLV